MCIFMHTNCLTPEEHFSYFQLEKFFKVKRMLHLSPIKVWVRVGLFVVLGDEWPISLSLERFDLKYHSCSWFVFGPGDCTDITTESHFSRCPDHKAITRK